MASSLHTSNKTRIETISAVMVLLGLVCVLYIHPIKQGLKPFKLLVLIHLHFCSLHTSNKTRIETSYSGLSSYITLAGSLHTSNKTRIETYW